MKITKAFLVTFTMVFFSPVANFSHAGGNVDGVIKYDGVVPNFREIKMDADPICLSHHTTGVFPETLVLGPDNTIANVFVRISKNLPQGTVYPVPAEPVVMSQQGCMYDPHVIGLMIGQELKILNPDGTLHNVHALSKVNPEFNLAMPKFRKETSKLFNKAEFMFPIKCDVHPWMGAWVAVMDNPYFDVTEVNGRFLIKDVPEGEYEIEAWHEKLGTQTARVLVKNSGSSQINFTFSRE